MSEEQSVQWTPEGREIPIPMRGDVLRDLRKVAKAPEPDSASDGVEDGPEVR